MGRSIASQLVTVALAAAALAGYACDGSPDDLTGHGPGGGAGAASGDGGGAPGDGGVTAITPASPFQRRIRRLTSAEYANTLNDLLGTTKSWAANLPADPVANGFDDDADALLVDQLFADEARINAEAIAASFDFSTIGCQPSAGEPCARSFAASFGAKALRRPLASAEVDSYAALFDSVSAASDPVSGMKAIVEAMLQSPSFLYRTELGGDPQGTTVALTPWEIASELSYLFWRTMPDDELRAHAQSGDLVQPAVIASEAARLLASPRASAMLDSFADQWLETNLLYSTPKDATTFPTYTPSLQGDLAGEVHAFFEASARDANGSLASMLTSTTSFLTPALAQLYGAQLGSGPASNGFVATTMPGGRGGLLTLGAILAVQATPLAGNPVRRGKLVRTQLLCQPMPPPPPGIAGPIPPLDPSTANKQAWMDHATNPQCSGCHDLLDPIGFGFDAFDAVGRALPGTIDSSGWISGTASTNTSFTGALDLEQKLAASADVQACFVKQWVRFALGVGDTSASDAEVQRVAATFPPGKAGVQGVLAALTSAPYFTARQADPGSP